MNQLVAIFKRLGLLLSVIILLPGLVSADTLSNEQKQLFQYGLDYVNAEGDDACNDSTSASVSLTGKDRVQKVYNYFITKGLTPVQSAGITGNFMQESTAAIIPTIMQIGGTSNNPMDAGDLGWGIAQWSPGSKIIKIAETLKITTPIYDLGTQLEIVWGEMNGKVPYEIPEILTGMKKTTDIASATEYFRANFEKGTMGNRVALAQQVYDTYGNSTAGSVSGSTAASCNTSGSVNCDPATQAAATDESLSATRQKAVCIALAEYTLWQTGVMGPSATKPYPYLKYTQGREEEWCADFVSWVYNQAGYPLKTGGKDGNVPSVSEVRSIGEAGGAWTYHPAPGYTPKAGDLIIHQEGPPGSGHVNMVMAVNTSKKTLLIVGGNQGGIQANNMSKVTEYSVTGFSGVDQITGYVSPKD